MNENSSPSSNIICVVCGDPILSEELVVPARGFKATPMHSGCFASVEHLAPRNLVVLNSSKYTVWSLVAVVLALVIFAASQGAFGRIPRLSVSDQQVQWDASSRGLIEAMKCNKLPSSESHDCLRRAVSQTGKYESEARRELSRKLNRDPHPQQYLIGFFAIPLLLVPIKRFTSWIRFERSLTKS